jgi:preprotein translocase subunit YajC
MVDFDTLSFILAQAPAPAGGGAPAPAGDPAAGGGMNMLVMFGIPLLLLYFLILRPSQRQEKERKRQIYSLKKGDDVAFAGGIFGTVVGIKEKVAGTPADGDEVTIRVDGSSRLRVLRSSIYQIFPAAAESETKDTPATT